MGYRTTRRQMRVMNAEQPKPARCHRLKPGECIYCDREQEVGNAFHPPHDASERCESGRNPHCSCDVCF